MSMNLEEKQLAGALRIFEALSGVDEELLAKCEDDSADVGLVRKHGIKGKNPIYKLNKYRLAGTLAAAVCALAVGITLWSNTLRFTDNATSQGCAVYEGAAAEAAPEEAPAEMEMAADAGAASAEVEMAATKKASGAEAAPLESEVTAADEKQQSGFAESNSGEIQSSTGENKDLMVQTESAPLDTRVDVTLTEVSEAGGLGQYVPSVLPAGYTWESGKAEVNSETGEYESIALCWVNGMDSINLFISYADATLLKTAYVEEEESYDVHLYELPYAETVPDKYRETFNSPVFKEGDFCLDIVKARMKSVADAGDTDTPRGDFAVLYEDGVLVRFVGRGSAEEIWEMFQSME